MMTWKWKFSNNVSLLQTLSKRSSIKGKNSLIPTADVTKKKEIKRRQPHETQKSISEYLLEQIVKGDVAATFPNAMTALRLFLTLPCGVASGERSFSLLKMVKSQLRSSMPQERVIALCLMAANFDVLRAIDPKKVICNFEAVKARRKTLAA